MGVDHLVALGGGGGVALRGGVRAEKLGVVIPSLFRVGPLALTFAQIGDDEEQLGVKIVFGADQAQALGVARVGFGQAARCELGFAEEVEREGVVGVGGDRSL